MREGLSIEDSIVRDLFTLTLANSVLIVDYT